MDCGVRDLIGESSSRFESPWATPIGFILNFRNAHLNP